jgi:hypothetical protein
MQTHHHASNCWTACCTGQMHDTYLHTKPQPTLWDSLLRSIAFKEAISALPGPPTWPPLMGCHWLFVLKLLTQTTSPAPPAQHQPHHSPYTSTQPACVCCDLYMHLCCLQSLPPAPPPTHMHTHTATKSPLPATYLSPTEGDPPSLHM